jgi:serine/threonine protein kinase
MSRLSDGAVQHLRQLGERPALPGERYEVGALLGQGGMGAVYRVWDRVLQRDVALKVLRPELATAEWMDRLDRESRILARLAHPGIVPIHDTGMLVDGRPGYLMRLLTGRRLDQLEPSTPLSERLRLFLRICETVEFAHRHEVIHRDLKPANVMLGEFGEVLVLDWGIARLGTAPEVAPLTAPNIEDPATTQPGAVLGTPGFMAPEQLRGAAGEIDLRTDVYALGAILKQLTAETGAERPRQLAAIWSRAMAADPGDRYQSVRTLATDVIHYLDVEPVSAYRESWLDRLQRFYARYQVPILLVLAYLLTRLLFVVWRTGR